MYEVEIDYSPSFRVRDLVHGVRDESESHVHETLKNEGIKIITKPASPPQ